MTEKEFNQKWDGRYRDGMPLDERRGYVSDCFDMCETEGFCNTFESPYEQMKRFNGLHFSVVRRCDENDWDLESLPAWEIEFDGGVKIDALSEEICKIDRSVEE